MPRSRNPGRRGQWTRERLIEVLHEAERTLGRKPSQPDFDPCALLDTSRVDAEEQDRGTMLTASERRPVPESNRITRLCRPLRSRPAHWPWTSASTWLSTVYSTYLRLVTAAIDKRSFTLTRSEKRDVLQGFPS